MKRESMPQDLLPASDEYLGGLWLNRNTDNQLQRCYLEQPEGEGFGGVFCWFGQFLWFGFFGGFGVGFFPLELRLLGLLHASPPDTLL